MNALEKSFNSARKRRKSNASAHPPAAINNEISSALFSWRAAAKLLSRLREKRRWRRRRERAVFFILQQRRRLSIHRWLLQLFRQFINNLRTSKFSAEQLGRFSPQALIYRRTKFHSSKPFCIHSKAAHLTGKVLKVVSLL
jgi:hypothetical protein